MYKQHKSLEKQYSKNRGGDREISNKVDIKSFIKNTRNDSEIHGDIERRKRDNSPFKGVYQNIGNVEVPKEPPANTR